MTAAKPKSTRADRKDIRAILHKTSTAPRAVHSRIDGTAHEPEIAPENTTQIPEKPEASEGQEAKATMPVKKKVKMTLEMIKEDHKRFRINAMKEDRTMTDVINDLLQKNGYFKD